MCNDCQILPQHTICFFLERLLTCLLLVSSSSSTDRSTASGCVNKRSSLSEETSLSDVQSLLTEVKGEEDWICSHWRRHCPKLHFQWWDWQCRGRWEMVPYQWRGWQCLWMWRWSRRGFVVLWFSDSILIVVSLTPPHDFDCCDVNPAARVHWEEAPSSFFPWRPVAVDWACVCTREGHSHQR